MTENTPCTLLDAELDAYLAGTLDAAAEDRVARHLTACTRCAAEVALAARVEFELAELPKFDLPAGRIAEIKRLARRQTATPVGGQVVPFAGRRRRLWPAALAASLLTAVLIAWWPGSEPASPTVAEVAAAEQEARYALALVAELGRKAGTQLRDDVLIERVATPLVEGVGRSLNRARREG